MSAISTAAYGGLATMASTCMVVLVGVTADHGSEHVASPLAVGVTVGQLQGHVAGHGGGRDAEPALAALAVAAGRAEPSVVEGFRIGHGNSHRCHFVLSASRPGRRVR